MEITCKIMKRVPYLLLLLLFANCDSDTTTIASKEYMYLYVSDETAITASQIGNGNSTFDPKGIAIANEKLYICNGDALEVFDAATFSYLKTITAYTRDNTKIPFTRLSSVCIDNGRIYIGSIDSRVFVLDEITNTGISTVGNGQWWQTFVHVFGITVQEGLLFVKEKENSIKVFETSQITETSPWNLAPIAKLNTLTGFDQIYSMDIASNTLVVAGRDAKSYLYYDMATIRSNAANSLLEPLKPEATVLKTNPISVSFTKEWAVTSEISAGSTHLKLYPKEEFLYKIYIPRLNASDVMGHKPFGNIVSTAQFQEYLLLSDAINKEVRIVKINTAVISEQQL